MSGEPRPNALLGTMQLAVGRHEGVRRFGNTPKAFLASLAPLVALPLVAAGLLAVSGKVLEGLAIFLVTLVAQLGPAVISHWLAARWGRGAVWMRYATAYNWCQWAIPLAASGVLIGAQLATGGTLSEEAGMRLLVLTIGIYGLWLNWLVARHGLAFSPLRAAAFVLAVTIGTGALIMAPVVVGNAFGQA